MTCYNGEEAYEINDYSAMVFFLSIYPTKLHAHIYAFPQISKQVDKTHTSS